MNKDNYRTFNSDLMGQIAFKTLSTKMKQEYFREKYEYIFGKKFRRDVYVPNKFTIDDNDYYPYFYRNEEDGCYDTTTKIFTSKTLHQKYLEESDVAWCARFNTLHLKTQALFMKCSRQRRKHWRHQMFLKYGSY